MQICFLGVGVFTLRIKAALFDLGNTLVKIWVPEAVFQKVLSSIGINRSLNDVRQAIVKADQDFEDLGYRSLYGKVSYKEYWSKWDSFVLRNLGFPENKKVAQEIQARWYNHVDCETYPDVEETLHRVKRHGLKTGLVSTGYEEDVYAILEKANLQRRLFDIIVGANTIGEEKPHPDVFRYALKSLNVKSREALFVGDLIDADYNGAENAGMKAILILRSANRTDETRGVRTIFNLQEIFKYID